jgi:hypothetical protein
VTGPSATLVWLGLCQEGWYPKRRDQEKPVCGNRGAVKKELKEQGSQDNKEGHEECTGAVEVENEKKDHDGGSSQTIRAINAAPYLE